MNPRMLRALTLIAAFAAAAVQAGCSKHVTDATSPATAPPAQQVANIPPDTWFAGPDPNDPAAQWQTDPGPFGGRYITWPNGTVWYDIPGVPNSMLSADSLKVLPSHRPEHRTFVEIYADRMWLRQEGDTVHINSHVIFPTGGSDPDSPYSVMVIPELLPFGLGPAPVLTPGPPNGSPIGFRFLLELRDVLGRVDQPSESSTYPFFDPRSQFQYPIINGGCGVTEAGRAYAVARAVDGDSAVDRRIDHQPGGAVGIVDRVEAGTGSAEDQALRSKILTFYVDHPARLLRESPGFFPPAHQVFASRTVNALNLLASDDDPYDALSHVEQYSHVGGPTDAPILRRRLAIVGGLASDPGRDTCFVVPGDFMSPAATFTIPDWIANGPITLVIRLCDCFECDVLPGPPACPALAGTELHPTFGACVDTGIPCTLAVPGPAAMVVH